jgi:phosphatidylglycerol lysyltransferase
MWLAEKSTREKGFSLGFFSEDYLRRFPAGIIRKDGKVMAFTNIWPGRGKEELSIDLMRYLPEAPRGVMECLFIQLMLWGKREGYRWFDPEWEPRYLASPHGLSLPRILANIAALISGGMKGIILK